MKIFMWSWGQGHVKVTTIWAQGFDEYRPLKFQKKILAFIIIAFVVIVKVMYDEYEADDKCRVA